MDKSEKISWFEQFKIACLKPSQYKRLLNLAKGKVILFLAAITLITTILGYGMDVAGFTVSVGGWKNFILNRLPAFELKDGTLSVDQEMDFEIGGVHFVADTSKDKVSTEDLSNKYQMELVFAKNEMVVKNTAVGNMMNTFSFKNMKNVEFNNQAMLSMVPMIRIFISDHVLYTMDCKYYFLFNSLYFLLQCSHILIREQEWTVRIEKMYPLERSLSCLLCQSYIELVETIGVTAGSAIFTGMAWMFISYFGSYQLLLAGFMRPEDRQKPDEML